MVKITFIGHNGDRVTVDARAGQSVMQAAVSNGVAGIEAVCGGNCACGTCRIYVDHAWREKLPPPGDSEREMIEYAEDPDPGVRLSCQIPVTEDLEGLGVVVPASQD